MSTKINTKTLKKPVSDGRPQLPDFRGIDASNVYYKLEALLGCYRDLVDLGDAAPHGEGYGLILLGHDTLKDLHSLVFGEEEK